MFEIALEEVAGQYRIHTYTSPTPSGCPHRLIARAVSIQPSPLPPPLGSVCPSRPMAQPQARPLTHIRGLAATRARRVLHRQQHSTLRTAPGATEPRRERQPNHSSIFPRSSHALDSHSRPSPSPSARLLSLTASHRRPAPSSAPGCPPPGCIDPRRAAAQHRRSQRDGRASRRRHEAHGHVR